MASPVVHLCCATLQAAAHKVTSVVIIAALLLSGSPGTKVEGHGRLIDPPSRATMWRYGFDAPANYDDNSGYCGGKEQLWSRFKGKCGVCGDPWEPKPRAHERGGRYYDGTPVRYYEQGGVINVVMGITANHRGWVEVRLCPYDYPEDEDLEYSSDGSFVEVTQACLDKHVLELADGSGTRFELPEPYQVGEYSVDFQLPAGVTCQTCLLQWKWNVANSWGTDPDGTSCLGCGEQEQFYACADIVIESGGEGGRGGGKGRTAAPKIPQTPAPPRPPPPPTRAPPLPPPPPPSQAPAKPRKPNRKPKQQKPKAAPGPVTARPPATAAPRADAPPPVYPDHGNTDPDERYPFPRGGVPRSRGGQENRRRWMFQNERQRSSSNDDYDEDDDLDDVGRGHVNVGLFPAVDDRRSFSAAPPPPEQRPRDDAKRGELVPNAPRTKAPAEPRAEEGRNPDRSDRKETGAEGNGSREPGKGAGSKEKDRAVTQKPKVQGATPSSQSPRAKPQTPDGAKTTKTWTQRTSIPPEPEDSQWQHDSVPSFWQWLLLNHPVKQNAGGQISNSTGAMSSASNAVEDIMPSAKSDENKPIADSQDNLKAKEDEKLPMTWWQKLVSLADQALWKSPAKTNSTSTENSKTSFRSPTTSTPFETDKLSNMVIEVDTKELRTTQKKSSTTIPTTILTMTTTRRATTTTTTATTVSTTELPPDVEKDGSEDTKSRDAEKLALIRLIAEKLKEISDQKLNKARHSDQHQQTSEGPNRQPFAKEGKEETAGLTAATTPAVPWWAGKALHMGPAFLFHSWQNTDEPEPSATFEDGIWARRQDDDDDFEGGRADFLEKRLRLYGNGHNFNGNDPEPVSIVAYSGLHGASQEVPQDEPMRARLGSRSTDPVSAAASRDPADVNRSFADFISGGTPPGFSEQASLQRRDVGASASGAGGRLAGGIMLSSDDSVLAAARSSNFLASAASDDNPSSFQTDLQQQNSLTPVFSQDGLQLIGNAVRINGVNYVQLAPGALGNRKVNTYPYGAAFLQAYQNSGADNPTANITLQSGSRLPADVVCTPKGRWIQYREMWRWCELYCKGGYCPPTYCMCA